MTNLYCEDLAHQASQSQPGYVQWGTYAADGTFEPVYAIEQQPSVKMAHYWLDAAGVCDIGGQRRMGQPNVDEQPKPAPAQANESAETSSANEGQVVVTEQQVQPSEVVNPITKVPLDYWWLAILLVVIACAVGSIWTRNRVKETDSTPNQYPQGLNIFNRGADDEQ